MIPLKTLKINPKNPRTIKGQRLADLVRSVKDFPKMMALRPIIVDDAGMILGGNMRFRALQELGYKEIPDDWVKRASDLTDEERQRFIIADNVGFGEWDYQQLSSWDGGDLKEWGLEININDQIDNMKDGEIIEFEQSVQIEPPMEYILIMAEPNSKEWEDMKQLLRLNMVRRGGYKKGSPFDAVGIERVIEWNEFKKRINVNSGTV